MISEKKKKEKKKKDEQRLFYIDTYTMDEKKTT